MKFFLNGVKKGAISMNWITKLEIKFAEKEKKITEQIAAIKCK